MLKKVLSLGFLFSIFYAFAQNATTTIKLNDVPECSDSILNYKNVEALLGLPAGYYVMSCNFILSGKADVFLVPYRHCESQGVNNQVKGFFAYAKKQGGKLTVDDIYVTNKGRRIKLASKVIDTK
jgi:hypothetical protein